MIIAEEYVGSNDFWNTIITVIIAVLVAILTAWAALRSVNPRRRIIWRQHVNSALLRDVNAATQVSVSHGQAVLTEPRLVELLLRNSGRRDVQSSDFVNGADSLVFDFGVPVISVLDSRTQPSTSAIPQLSYSGNELQIHPGLIAKGQTLELAVLVDGGKRDVDVKFATILETPVKRGDQGDFETTSTRLFRFANVAGPIIGVAAMIALTISSIIALENSSDLIRRDRDLMEESSAELRKASDNLDLLRKCRYWDLRDPERAKKECPRVLKPN